MYLLALQNELSPSLQANVFDVCEISESRKESIDSTKASIMLFLHPTACEDSGCHLRVVMHRGKQLFL